MTASETEMVSSAAAEHVQARRPVFVQVGELLHALTKLQDCVLASDFNMLMPGQWAGSNAAASRRDRAVACGRACGRDARHRHGSR